MFICCTLAAPPASDNHPRVRRDADDIMLREVCEDSSRSNLDIANRVRDRLRDEMDGDYQWVVVVLDETALYAVWTPTCDRWFWNNRCGKNVIVLREEIPGRSCTETQRNSARADILLVPHVSGSLLNAYTDLQAALRTGNLNSADVIAVKDDKSSWSTYATTSCLVNEVVNGFLVIAML